MDEFHVDKLCMLANNLMKVTLEKLSLVHAIVNFHQCWLISGVEIWGGGGDLAPYRQRSS